MNTPLTAIIHPLIILASLILCPIVALILIKERKKKLAPVPRNYIEEIRDYLRGHEGEKPVAAVRLYLLVLSEIRPSWLWIKLWSELLTGPFSRILPARMYRVALRHLVSSAGVAV